MCFAVCIILQDLSEQVVSVCRLLAAKKQAVGVNILCLHQCGEVYGISEPLTKFIDFPICYFAFQPIQFCAQEVLMQLIIFGVGRILSTMTQKITI